MSPAVRKLGEENDLDSARIKPTGKDGRLVKADVLAAIEAGTAKVQRGAAPAAPGAPSAAPAGLLPPRPEDPRERVKMTPASGHCPAPQGRRTPSHADHLQRGGLGAVMELRNEYKDAFEKKHGVRLGFMSFFLKACIAALKELPAVNAEIYGDELIYKNYYDIGVAVGTPSGLVVPIVRDADTLSFADVEKTINGLGLKARDGKLTIADMTGNTFDLQRRCLAR